MRLSILVSLFFMSIQVCAQTPVVNVGELVRIEAFESQYVSTKTIDVWLPPRFREESGVTKAYSVIYMHDGQMLFDANVTWNKQEWQVDEVAGNLIATGQVEPFIVVGIWNADENRHSEYFPQKPFESLSALRQKSLYNKQRMQGVPLLNSKVYSDSYLAFIVKELKPFIEKQYPVDSDSAYLMGSSMGGLISWYGLLEYPDVFRGAACLSTHWPGDSTATDNKIPLAFQHFIQGNLHKLSDHKLYFDYGTKTLDALYPPLQNEVDRVIKSSGYPPSLWKSVKFDGAAHTENAWSERLHVPILFLLGKE